MSNNQDSNKKQETFLTNQIISELNLLPQMVKEKKSEIVDGSKEIIGLREKLMFLNKELEKISSNLMSLEKEYSLLVIKTGNLKSKQKLILNAINNCEIVNLDSYFSTINPKIKEIIQIFVNFADEYSGQLEMVVENQKELTSMLIGAYSYLKILNKDIPSNYLQIKNKISKILKEIITNNKKDTLDNDNENDALSILIISYIKNILKLLNNKEKMISLEKKLELNNEKKDKIFLKLKLVEDQKKKKENSQKDIHNYIADILSLIEKHKLFNKYSKTKLLKFLKSNKTNLSYKINSDIKHINTSGNHLDLSSSINNTEKFNNKASFQNEIKTKKNKISCIKIDLMNNINDYDIYKNQKTLDSIDDVNRTNDKDMNYLKQINLSQYNNINDLKNDIYLKFMELKNSPLYGTKAKKCIKKDLNTFVTPNNNNLASKFQIVKKNNNCLKKDDSKNKNYSDNNKAGNAKVLGNYQKKKKNNNINDSKIIISKVNTTISSNNPIVYNSNELDKRNDSFDSKPRKIKINHYTSFNKTKNYPPKNGPTKVGDGQINTKNKLKLIPYLTHSYQIDKENGNNESKLIKKKSNIKISNEIKKYIRISSRLYSPNKTKTNINNNIKHKAYRKIKSPFVNFKSLDENKEQLLNKTNEPSTSKMHKKNIYVNIKHNKTNINIVNISGNDNHLQNRKSLNKIQVRIIKNENNSNNKSTNLKRKNSTNEFKSNLFLVNLFKNEFNNNSHNKNLKRSVNENTKRTQKEKKINIELNKEKNKSPAI